MSRRVALYFRVSTADQTPDAQIRELRIYAEQRGFDVVAEFVDTASGAARSRPELDRMMTVVRKRKVDVVLVWAFDRFARSTSDNARGAISSIICGSSLTTDPLTPVDGQLAVPDGPGLGVELDRDALDHYRCADPCLA